MSGSIDETAIDDLLAQTKERFKQLYRNFSEQTERIDNAPAPQKEPREHRGEVSPGEKLAASIWGPPAARPEVRRPDPQQVRTIRTRRCWYGDRTRIFNKGSVDIPAGRTILVGVNGSGKSTLIDAITETLSEIHVPYKEFDNTGMHGGQSILARCMSHGDMTGLASAYMSSEGERMIMSGNSFFERVSEYIRSNHGGECWVLLDAVDSGLSIDNIVDMKGLLDMMEQHAQGEDVTLYVIAAANAFELVCGERCLEPKTGRFMEFHDYDSYRKFCLDSRKRKEKRDGIRPRDSDAKRD